MSENDKSVEKTVLQVVCAWCGKSMGEKDGEGIEGFSHSICQSCWQKHYPGIAYPEEENNVAEGIDKPIVV